MARQEYDVVMVGIMRGIVFGFLLWCLIALTAWLLFASPAST